MLSIAERFKSLKEGLKKASVKAKDKLKNAYDQMGKLSDPDKTTIHQRETFFVEMNMKLRESDPEYTKFINWVISQFVSIGYQINHDDILTMKGENDSIHSLTFNFQQLITYDPFARHWEEKVNLLLNKGDIEDVAYKRYWEEDWKGKRKVDDWKLERKIDSDRRRRVRQQQEEEFKDVSKTEKEIMITGHLTFYLDYEEDVIQYDLLIDVKDPRVLDKHERLGKHLKQLAKFIVKQLNILVYSEMTDHDLTHIKSELEKSVPEFCPFCGESLDEHQRCPECGMDVMEERKDFTELVDEIDRSNDDGEITDSEINEIVLDVMEIDDGDFKKKMENLLKEIKNTKDKRKKRDAWIHAREILKRYQEQLNGD